MARPLMKYQSLFRACWLTKYFAVYGGLCCHSHQESEERLKYGLQVAYVKALGQKVSFNDGGNPQKRFLYNTTLSPF